MDNSSASVRRPKCAAVCSHALSLPPVGGYSSWQLWDRWGELPVGAIVANPHAWMGNGGGQRTARLTYGCPKVELNWHITRMSR